MIIVTGCNGFIGSNLVRYLTDQGFDVRGVDFESRLYNTDCINFVAEDFYNRLDQYMNGITTVFHEGAISSTTETDNKKLFLKNIEPSLKLIQFCRGNNIPLQYASSASVYGNMSRAEWQLKNKKMNPLNQYAVSKKTVDYVADLVINSTNPPCLLQSMRYFNVYGPNEDHKEDQSSPHSKFKKQLLETGKIKLFKNSRQFYRDFIHVNQVIDMKMKALKSMPSGFYDVGTSKPISFYDVALQVFNEHHIKNADDYIEWIDMPSALEHHYQRYSYADTSWL